MSNVLVEDLRAARALIDTPKKWQKGRFGTLGAPMCASGACWNLPISTARRKATRAALNPALPAGTSLVAFNDDIATHSDIMALFDRAIDAALAQAGATP